jgi:hypothetical protein
MKGIGKRAVTTIPLVLLLLIMFILRERLWGQACNIAKESK